MFGKVCRHFCCLPCLHRTVVCATAVSEFWQSGADNLHIFHTFTASCLARVTSMSFRICVRRLFIVLEEVDFFALASTPESAIHVFVCWCRDVLCSVFVQLVIHARLKPFRSFSCRPLCQPAWKHL